MADKTNEEYSLLYDYYGSLLTERQRETFKLYHEENYSLSEIGENFGVSRQAVHISLGKARDELEAYEKKLGLIAKHNEFEKVLQEVETRADMILKDKARMAGLDAETAKNLRKIKKIVKGLDI